MIHFAEINCDFFINQRTNAANGTQITKNINTNSNQYPQQQFAPSQSQILNLNDSPHFSNSRRNSIDLKGTSNKLSNNIDQTHQGQKLQKVNFQIPQTLPNAYLQQNPYSHPPMQHLQQQHHLDQIDSNQTSSSSSINNANNSNTNPNNIDNSLLLTQQQHHHQQQQLYSNNNNEIQFSSNLMNNHPQQLNGAFQMNGGGNANTNSNQGFILSNQQQHFHQQLQQQFNQQQQINNLSDKFNQIENHLNNDRYGPMMSNNSVNLAMFDDIFLK